jgi:colanic acid/amylovoran biosynthesis protein
MHQCKDILLVNFHSAKNAGDLALLEQSIMYLNRAFGSPRISILANWPEEIELKSLDVEILPSVWSIVGVGNQCKKPLLQIITFFEGFIFLIFWLSGARTESIDSRRFFWEKAFSALKNTDLIIAVPGNQMFSSNRKPWPLPTLLFPLWLAKIFHRKVIVLPQSIGPFRTAIEKFMVGSVYNKVNKVFIRDEVSYKLAKSMKISASKPEIFPDLAFSYPSKKKQEAIALLEKYGWKPDQKNIGLTVIAPMPSYLDSQVMNGYYQAVSNALRNLIETGNYIYIFNQVTGPSKDEDDGMASNRLIQAFDQMTSDQIHQITDKLSPSLLKASYGLMDAFIASRLHSGIFSISMNVPTLFIGYLHKTEGILRPLGLEYFFLDINSLTANKITTKVQYLLDHKLELTSALEKINHDVVIKLDSLPNKIEEIWRTS